MNAAKGLFVAAVVTEITGVLVVIGALAASAGEPVLALVFGEPVAAGPAARLGLGIAGALMAGWGAMLAVLARSIPAISPAVLGTAVAIGTVTWFVLDGIVSVAAGAALNVVGNTLFLVLLMVPALALRRGNAVAGTAH